MNSRPLYIFDLDGTLALIDHRRHLVEAPWVLAGDPGYVHGIKGKHRVNADGMYEVPDPKFKPDWDLFFKACAVDAPNYPVIGVLLQLYQIGADIQIWSGRSDAVRDITVQWLFTHMSLQPHVATKMLANMRPDGDFTPDEQLKQKWLNALPKDDRARLAGVFDDRDKVVRMWRKNGLTCFQVAPGNF